MKNVLINLTCKNFTKYNKAKFINLLGVDLEKCQYEIFDGKKYTKKLYGNDLFLFFSKNKFIGATIGAIYQKDFENYTKAWRIERKNRTGLESMSNLIIRIPEDQRIYRPRYNKKYNPIIKQQQPIKKRLEDYKRNKTNNVSDEIIMGMLQDLTNYIFKNVNNIENLQKFEKIYNWTINAGNLLSEVGSLMKEYQSCKNNFESEKKNYKEYCNKKNMEYNWKDEDSFSLNKYKDSIIEINKWYNIIK